MLGDVIFLLNIDISQSGSNEAFNCKHFLTNILLVTRNYSNTKIGNTLSNIIYQATTEMETARRAGRELRWRDNRNQHHNNQHHNHHHNNHQQSRQYVCSGSPRKRETSSHWLQHRRRTERVWGVEEFYKQIQLMISIKSKKIITNRMVHRIWRKCLFNASVWLIILTGLGLFAAVAIKSNTTPLFPF